MTHSIKMKRYLHNLLLHAKAKQANEKNLNANARVVIDVVDVVSDRSKFLIRVSRRLTSRVFGIDWTDDRFR